MPDKACFKRGVSIKTCRGTLYTLLYPTPLVTYCCPTHRSKEYIGLNLSVVVWKALVGQELQLFDLENVDVLLTRSMQDIRTIDQKGERRGHP